MLENFINFSIQKKFDGKLKKFFIYTTIYTVS